MGHEPCILMVYLPPSLQRQSSASGHAGPSWILSEREQTSLICASALALAQLILLLGAHFDYYKLGAGPGNEASDPLKDCRSQTTTGIGTRPVC